MLLIETYIKESPGKGIGLFTKVNIAKGTKYWVRDEIFDKVITQTLLQSHKKIARNYIKNHGFLEKTSNWYLCSDNARFTNHSKIFSNTEHHFNKNGLIQCCTTKIDIKVDEEIFCDYTEICLTCINGVGFEEI